MAIEHDPTRNRPVDGTIYEQLLHLLAEGSRAQLGMIQETSQELLQTVAPSHRNALERVRRGVWEIGTLISDVTDFYAYSTGRLNETDSDFDLRVTLEGIRSRLARTQPQVGWMAISRIRHDVPPLLRGKPARLQDILLGVTAAMAPAWHEGTLRIDVAKGWERGQEIELIFRCEVRPAEPVTPEHVVSFRMRMVASDESLPLVRHDLRLQLARRLALAGGGSLTPVTEDGALGFELKLPFTMRSVPESSPEAPTSLTLRGRRALIADADESRRNRLGAILRLWGLQTETCGTSRAVLEKLRGSAAQGRPFDFGLINAELEDTDGAIMGRLIQEGGAGGLTRLMMLVGVGLRGDAKLAEQVGYDAYLPRTISIHELREALVVLLQRATNEATNVPIVTQHSLADVRLEGVRILLVTSDPVGGLVLEAVLRRKGFRVDRVNHVSGAAERCEKVPYDFLVLDVAQMSEQDLSLAAGLRVLLDEHGPTPIAVLVERQDSPEEVRGLEGLSPDAVFTKPVDLEQICTFCEGAMYPDLAANSMPPRPSQDAIVFVVSNTPGDEEPVVFEKDRLDEATMGIESLQLSVVESYLDEMPRRIDAVSTAVMSGQMDVAEREVLSARAIALTIGAFATARCLGTLGEQIGQRRVEEAQTMITRLRTEAERSLAVLREAHATLQKGKRAA